MRQGLLEMDAPPPTPSLTREDWLGALAVFLLVFLSTFPVVIPFLIFRDVQLALRASNLVALVMMFALGQCWHDTAGIVRSERGLGVSLIGVALVVITIALGG